MTDNEFNKFDKHYNKLVKKGTIKTMNDAYIYKLAIEKAIKVIRCCETFEGKEVPTFEEWKKDNYIHYDKGTFTRKAEGLRDLEQLKQKYNKEILNL